MDARDPVTTQLLAAEEPLARSWGARLAVDGVVPRLARDLLHEVVLALATTGSPGALPRAALAETAAAVGVLRAQQGHTTAGVVEDVLALRPLLAGHVGRSVQAQGDVGLLLLLQERLSAVLDTVLRCTVDAHVDESQRVLQQRATRDPLTGLLNRAGFEEALQHEVAASDREAPPALLLVDLDGFKAVNDTLGHLAGDEVLVRVARLLEGNARRADVVARLGGDEFAVLLPRTSRSRAVQLAQRLLARVAADPGLAGPPPVGLSVGVAWQQRPRSGADLVALADEAMYVAKRGGGHAVSTGTRGSHTTGAGDDRAAALPAPAVPAVPAPRGRLLLRGGRR